MTDLFLPEFNILSKIYNLSADSTDLNQKRFFPKE